MGGINIKVLIFGGTGFIGKRLIEELLQAGYDVVLMTRDREKAKNIFDDRVAISEWDKSLLIVPSPELENIDYIINLAGEMIGSYRWTESRKERILKSRVETTKAIVDAITYQVFSPQLLINASAIGFYGAQNDEELTENCPSGNDFLATVCQEWENEVFKAEELAMRTVTMRIGLVLGNGGVLKQIVLPYRFFLGGPLGSGKQWLSWIHIDDLIGIIKYTLENDQISGPVNATAPNPVTMNKFSNTLGNVLNKPSKFRVPSGTLRLLLGEMADLLVNGQKVIPEKITEAGYKYKYPLLEKALKDLLRN